MIERRKRETTNPSGGSYFSSPKEDIQFIKTGSKMLDLAMGGGWARRRVGNVIGDKSTGKTLLMIEACANFAISEPRGKIRYREAEAAFDQNYAAALGMPIDRVDFGDPDKPMETVEDLFEELTHRIDTSKQPELFIIDSLDALSTREETKRAIDKGSYGGDKAKKMSEMFRRLIRKMGDKDITLLVVSQVRDKIGVMFGRKWTRTGGRALDFYASQVLVLSQIGHIDQTIKGVKRTTGIKVRGKVDKNKISLAYREAEFPILFGYGIGDEESCRDWLDEVKVKHANVKDAQLHGLVQHKWFEIEDSFLPKKRKYG